MNFVFVPSNKDRVGGHILAIILRSHGISVFGSQSGNYKYMTVYFLLKSHNKQLKLVSASVERETLSGNKRGRMKSIYFLWFASLSVACCARKGRKLLKLLKWFWLDTPQLIHSVKYGIKYTFSSVLLKSLNVLFLFI